MLPIKEKLNKISASFCAAKWLQVTLRLQNGHTHSCHHPLPHRVPLNELKKSASALHNTNQKKIARKQMLQGERPNECSYCWKVEDLPGEQVSDRFVKSSDPWSAPHIEDIAKLPWDADVAPKYLEVSFSNICNFKCAYCFPDVSSKILNESVEHGPYPTSEFYGSLLYLKKKGIVPWPESANPYLEAFWKWLPEVVSGLKVVRVTGGEPLLSKDCLRLLDYLDEHPNPQMTLAINSNFGVPSKLLKRVFEKCRKLMAEEKVKDVEFYTSIDTWGEQAEYIRSGLDLNLWKSHLETGLKEYPEFNYTIMVAFHALSVFRFQDLLKYVYQQKNNSSAQLLVDISILHTPNFLNLLIMPHNLRSQIQSCLDFMRSHMASEGRAGYTDYELSKMRSLVEYAKTTLPGPELRSRRTDFVSFVREYDSRKRLSFVGTFPQMAEEFKCWKAAEESQRFRKIKIRLLCWGQKKIWPWLRGRHVGQGSSGRV